MLNFIWIFLMTFSFLCAAFTGNMEAFGTSLIESGEQAVTFLISIGGMMAMWSGFMSVAEKSGITNIISKLISPLVKWLFDSAKTDKKCKNAICMNMVANFLGLSNAATPFGLKAMKLLNEKNHNKNLPSRDMCMLAVINSASIQLIPSTLIAVRTTSGCNNPGAIILPIWIVSFVTALTGILLAKMCGRKDVLH